MEKERANLKQCLQDRQRGQETIGEHKKLLSELSVKADLLKKYEDMVKARFSELERVVWDVSNVKAQYHDQLSTIKEGRGV